jgi:hypothetical protein
VEVGGFEFVAIDHADFADAGAGEVLEYGDAKAAAADDEYAAVAQFRLAFVADFFQRDLSRVVGAGFGALCRLRFYLRWRGLPRGAVVVVVIVMVLMRVAPAVRVGPTRGGVVM